jgi:hypothetical protein
MEEAQALQFRAAVFLSFMNICIYITYKPAVSVVRNMFLKEI